MPGNSFLLLVAVAATLLLLQTRRAAVSGKIFVQFSVLFHAHDNLNTL